MQLKSSVFGSLHPPTVNVENTAIPKVPANIDACLPIPPSDSVVAQAHGVATNMFYPSTLPLSSPMSTSARAARQSSPPAHGEPNGALPRQQPTSSSQLPVGAPTRLPSVAATAGSHQLPSRSRGNEQSSATYMMIADGSHADGDALTTTDNNNGRNRNRNINFFSTVSSCIPLHAIGKGQDAHVPFPHWVEPNNDKDNNLIKRRSTEGVHQVEPEPSPEPMPTSTAAGAAGRTTTRQRPFNDAKARGPGANGSDSSSTFSPDSLQPQPPQPGSTATPFSEKVNTKSGTNMMNGNIDEAYGRDSDDVPAEDRGLPGPSEEQASLQTTPTRKDAKKSAAAGTSLSRRRKRKTVHQKGAMIGKSNKEDGRPSGVAVSASVSAVLRPDQPPTPVKKPARSRSKAKAKSQGSNGAASSNNSNSNDKGGGLDADLGDEPTCLSEREERLSAILKRPQHEYHEFARYIRDKYELTENTDRLSSKDYVRLCNLKDDYHRQCDDDQTKLKIYRIKSFFANILKLEVTGEWDRHNHGGVRGPYVYGIRLRVRNDAQPQQH